MKRITRMISLAGILLIVLLLIAPKGDAAVPLLDFFMHHSQAKDIDGLRHDINHLNDVVDGVFAKINHYINENKAAISSNTINVGNNERARVANASNIEVLQRAVNENRGAVSSNTINTGNNERARLSNASNIEDLQRAVNGHEGAISSNTIDVGNNERARLRNASDIEDLQETIDELSKRIEELEERLPPKS